MAWYNDIGSVLSGGTPLGQVNAGMNKLGAIMNKPGVAQALAMAGQLGTGMGGRGLLANDVSTLATNLAAGKGVGVGTQPTLPGVIPTNPQQPAQPTTQTPSQVSQTAPAGEPTTTVTRKYDVNGDGVVTNDEIKYVNSGGALTRVGTELLNHPTLSAGSQAGMPVAAPQAPARELSRNDNLMMLSGLTNPNFALEVAKQEPIQTKAQADMMEAQYKHAMLAPTYAKTAAEAAKINWEMSPDYIQFQGALENAKRNGNLAAERYNLEQLARIADQQTFNHPVLGKMTGGQIIRMTGVTNPSAVSALISTAVSARNADVAAGATIGAARIRAAGEVSAADISSTKAVLANQIAMINQARAVVSMYEKQRMVAPETQWKELDQKKNEWEATLNEYKTQHANTLKLLGQNVPSETTPGNPPAKLTIPFEATSELKADKKINGKVYPKGTKLMIVNGGAYDSNGNLISTVK
jgi:hypothetical protein